MGACAVIEDQALKGAQFPITPEDTAVIRDKVRQITAEESPRRERLPDERPGYTIHKEIHSPHVGTWDVYLTLGYYPGTQRIGEIFLRVEPTGERIQEVKLLDTALSRACDLWAMAASSLIQLGQIAMVVEKYSFQGFEPTGRTNDAAVPFAHSPIDWAARTLARIAAQQEGGSHGS
jgi:hypothetical protein